MAHAAFHWKAARATTQQDIRPAPPQCGSASPSKGVQATGDGTDLLIGGAGRDVLMGGGGKDTVLFSVIGELSGATMSAADVIIDFVSALGDRIDLSGVDAIRSTAGVNDAFKWIGTAAFSKQPGERRYAASGGVGLVSGDIDGNGIADFAIHLDRALGLTALDFVL